MPQVTIDVEAIRINGLTVINAKSGDRTIRSTLTNSEITDVNTLAAWLLAQRGSQRATDQNLQKRLSISYHIDQVIDPDTGQPVDQTVIDSVQSQQLPADDGRSQFSALTGWSSWTAAEAESWIETNVTDLASAKNTLKAMAKAIVYLRNISVD